MTASNDIALFPYKPDGSRITFKFRTTMRDGEPWFVLADVCSVLEIANAGNVSARLDDDEKATIHNADSRAGSGAQSFTIVNESGLWSLVLTSRKPEAKAFKKWLTSVVIPSLRKTGSYVVGEERIATATTPQDLQGVQEAIQENALADTRIRVGTPFSIE